MCFFHFQELDEIICKACLPMPFVRSGSWQHLWKYQYLVTQYWSYQELNLGPSLTGWVCYNYTIGLSCHMSRGMKQLYAWLRLFLRLTFFNRLYIKQKKLINETKKIQIFFSVIFGHVRWSGQTSTSECRNLSFKWSLTIALNLIRHIFTSLESSP